MNKKLLYIDTEIAQFEAPCNEQSIKRSMILNSFVIKEVVMYLALKDYLSLMQTCKTTNTDLEGLSQKLIHQGHLDKLRVQFYLHKTHHNLIKFIAKEHNNKLAH